MLEQDKAMSFQEKDDYAWKIVGWIILSIRFVQGWIFWGGGSRRFFYAPQKLDPYATQWMANKLQSAMPGALLGVGHIISFLLHHFFLLYVAILIFSFIELASGLALIFGFFTRAAGFITALLSITLMLVFGWEGGTCLDEWTMAVCNLAMGLTLALTGSSVLSIDSWLLQRFPNLRQKNWFLILASGPWKFATLKKIGMIYLIFSILFTLITYNYYRGAIYSRYHVGPVSAIVHHMKLSDGQLSPDGAVTFTAYVNAGNPSIPSHIIRIELLSPDKKVIETWEGKDLSILPQKNIQNDYRYNRIHPSEYGLVAPVSARAKITLTPTITNLNLTKGQYQLQVYSIGGHRWDLNLEGK